MHYGRGQESQPEVGRVEGADGGLTGVRREGRVLCGGLERLAPCAQETSNGQSQTDAVLRRVLSDVARTSNFLREVLSQACYVNFLLVVRELGRGGERE